MTRFDVPLLMACILAGATAAAQTDPAFREPRGELLYSTHCIGCHSVQMHWRDAKVATDWRSLKEQVRRWQNSSGLTWTDAEINAVARHLNTLYYHFPPDERVARSPAAPRSNIQ